MPRTKRMIEREDGWCDIVSPDMDRFRLACCDCGLVHDMVFRALKVSDVMTGGRFTGTYLDPKEYRVQFRARRNNRATAAARRKR